jgi:CrcB protein
MNPKSHFHDTIWVAAGGAIGASLRYGTGQLLQQLTNQDTIFTATAIENIVGSFLIGLIYTILISRTGRNHRLSLFLLTGVVGSYTTYSGFMIENLIFLQSDLKLFAGYFVFQMGTGIAAAITGSSLGKSWIQFLRKSK